MYWRSRKTYIHENEELMAQLADNFLSEKPKKRVFGNFRIEKNKLIYKTKSKVNFSTWGNDKDKLKRAKSLLRSVRVGKIALAPNSRGSLPTIEQLEKELMEGRVYFDYYKEEVNTVAIKLKRKDGILFLGNSSILPLVGRTVAYGNVDDNRSVTLIQKILEQKISMLPFIAFEQSGLDLTKIKVLEKGDPEVVRRKVEYRVSGETQHKLEDLHFTGASLFEVDGKIFLFDIDRREVDHKIFNPFIAEIPKKVSTIKEAYVALKPKLVKDAEKNGFEVLRQGEWFFVKQKKAPKMPKMSERDKLLAVFSNELGYSFRDELLKSAFNEKKLRELRKEAERLQDMMPKPLILKAGDNRPNNVKLGFREGKTTYVTGEVTHSGREHAPLKLDGWYIAIPNTATKSFTITGDID